MLPPPPQTSSLLFRKGGKNVLRPTRLSIILGFSFFFFSSDIPLFLHLSFPIHFVWGERCRRSLPAKGAGATRYISKSITSPSLNKIEDRMGFQSVLVYWSHNWDSRRYWKTEFKFEIRFDPQGSFNTLYNGQPPLGSTELGLMSIRY